MKMRDMLERPVFQKGRIQIWKGKGDFPFIVYNRKSEFLGYIYFRDSWNEWVFMADPDCGFNEAINISVSCMKVIISFLEKEGTPNVKQN